MLDMLNLKIARKRETKTRVSKEKRYEVNGELMTVAEMAAKFNLPVTTIVGRLHQGWPMSRIGEPKKTKAQKTSSWRKSGGAMWGKD